MGAGEGGVEVKPRSESNPLTLQKMKRRLKERSDLPKDTQNVLAEPESESHFPASQQTLYCLLEQGKKKSACKFLEGRNNTYVLTP